MKITYKLFPNPFNDKISLDFAQTASSPEKVTIVNSVGQKVFETTELSPKMDIDLAYLPNGVYYVFIHDDHEITRPLKLMKN